MRIQGTFATGSVVVNGELLLPSESQRLWNHSPDGFNWGYEGSGPAQLALALLLKTGIGAELAGHLHQLFKRQFIASLPQADFAITIDVPAWIAANRRPDAEESNTRGTKLMPTKSGNRSRQRWQADAVGAGVVRERTTHTKKREP